MEPGKPMKLGEILVAESAISQEQLDHALAIQREKGGFLGRILVELGMVTTQIISSCLVRQCKIPHLSLQDYEINREVLQLLPEELCLRYLLLPIDKLGRILTVAMVDPLNAEALEHVRHACPELRIKPILCDWQHFEAVVSKVFGHPAKRGDGEEEYESFGLSVAKPKPAAQPAPVLESTPEPDAALPEKAIHHDEPPVVTPVSPVADEAGENAEHSSISTSEAMDMAVMDLLLQAETVQPRQPSEPVAEVVSQVPVPVSQKSRRPSEDLGAAADASVRERMREDEALAVARANLRDLEARDQERARRQRHASVSVLGSASANDEHVWHALMGDELLPGLSFDTFVAGHANAFCFRLCQAVAGQPGGAYNPFFLHGDVGLGKTHLLNAIGHAVRDREPGARLGYVSASRFASRLQEAIRDRAEDAFRANYCHWDLLILDDIQFLGGRVEAQEEFFHIFNVLQQEGRQIIIAGDKPPDRLGLLEQRLVSRFASGIVAHVKPPEWETRMAILESCAARIGATIHREALEVAATRAASDVRKLIGALRKLAAYGELMGTEVNREMALDALSHLDPVEAA